MRPIRTTIVPIMHLIHTTLMPIRRVFRTTIMPIASAVSNIKKNVKKKKKKEKILPGKSGNKSFLICDVSHWLYSFFFITKVWLYTGFSNVYYHVYTEPATKVRAVVYQLYQYLLLVYWIPVPIAQMAEHLLRELEVAGSILSCAIPKALKMVLAPMLALAWKGNGRKIEQDKNLLRLGRA